MSVDEYLSVRELPRCFNLKLVFEGQVYKFLLDACYSYACLSVKCRIRCRQSYFRDKIRVSQHESKIQNTDPLSTNHLVVYLIDFEKGLAVLRT